MRKLFKSRKALSPVVAAIILIAVTVAVSIAVAAWMGALTFTFMRTESLSITNMTFAGTTSANKNITCPTKNPGTSKVTVAEIRVNDVAVSSSAITGSLTFEPGDVRDIVIKYAWTAGNNYKVTMLSGSGTVVAAYEKTAA